MLNDEVITSGYQERTHYEAIPSVNCETDLNRSMKHHQIHRNLNFAPFKDSFRKQWWLTLLFSAKPLRLLKSISYFANDAYQELEQQKCVALGLY